MLSLSVVHQRWISQLGSLGHVESVSALKIPQRPFAKELSSKFEQAISTHCVYRALGKSGYKKALGYKSALLTPRQRSARLKFCKENRSRGWNTVVDSEESIFKVGDRGPGSGPKRVETESFPQVNSPNKIMVLEAISVTGIR